MWGRLLLCLCYLAVSVSPAPAGIFRKSVKPDPAQRVPELLKTLREDRDEHKRADAAEELREYELKAFPDIMTALIDALQNDPNSSVRAQAANSIGRLRPISQQAGYALEQALQNDASLRVRVAARTTLWEYHLLGYRSGNGGGQNAEQTDEPPLADPPPVPRSAPQKTPNQPKPAPSGSQPHPTSSRPFFPILFPRKEHRMSPSNGQHTGQPPAVSPNTERPPLPPLPRRPAVEPEEAVSGPVIPRPPKSTTPPAP